NEFAFRRGELKHPDRFGRLAPFRGHVGVAKSRAVLLNAAGRTRRSRIEEDMGYLINCEWRRLLIRWRVLCCRRRKILDHDFFAPRRGLPYFFFPVHSNPVTAWEVNRVMAVGVASQINDQPRPRRQRHPAEM